MPGPGGSPAGRSTPVSGRSSRPATSPSPGQRSGDITFLIRGRGPDFTGSSGTVFPAAGTKMPRTAVHAPRMNATCERLAGTLRRELPGRVLILDERHLRAILAEHQAHYNTARPHQGIAQRAPGDKRHATRATVTGIGTQRSAENLFSTA